MIKTPINRSVAMDVVPPAPPNLNLGYHLTDIEDEDDDLFEIDLDAVGDMPPPTYYWGRYITSSATTVLFANCLLPITDVSKAIPASVPSVLQTMPRGNMNMCLSLSEPITLGKLLQLPYPRALISLLTKR
ncbi:hypothetical protein SAY87_024081 [Trapa incisa]|uniref:Uncharacterized protein n=1 Tax=Trapa incisa TaxID=236973 RepID=A0AAN7QUB7_9MYRT|nr:hypothetical protein SAY87_024081 [Trapa incisa]